MKRFIFARLFNVNHQCKTQNFRVWLKNKEVFHTKSCGYQISIKFGLHVKGNSSYTVDEFTEIS